MDCTTCVESYYLILIFFVIVIVVVIVVVVIVIVCCTSFLRFMLVDMSVHFVLINPDYRATISKNASYVLGYVNFVATLHLGCR